MAPTEPSPNLYVPRSWWLPVFNPQKGDYPPATDEVPSASALLSRLDIPEDDESVRADLGLKPEEPVTEAHRITYLIGKLYDYTKPNPPESEIQPLDPEIQPYGPELQLQDEEYKDFAPFQLCRIELLCLPYNAKGEPLKKPQTWLRVFNRAQQAILQIQPDMIMPEEEAKQLSPHGAIIRLGKLLARLPRYETNSGPKFTFPKIVRDQLDLYVQELNDQYNFVIILGRDQTSVFRKTLKGESPDATVIESRVISKDLAAKSHWWWKTIGLGEQQ